MASVNKVIILGNLGNDPDIRTTQSGSIVANISVATSEKWKDKQSGQQQEKTEWHRVVFFGKLAEIVQQYLKKGSQVYVEGSLRTNKWQDKNGVDRYTTEITAREMKILGGQHGGSQPANYTAPNPANPKQDRPPPQVGYNENVPF